MISSPPSSFPCPPSFFAASYTLVYTAEYYPNGSVGYRPILLSNNAIRGLFNHSVTRNIVYDKKTLQPLDGGDIPHTIIPFFPLPRSHKKKKRSVSVNSTQSGCRVPPVSSLLKSPGDKKKRSASATRFQGAHLEKSLKARFSWKFALHKVKSLLQKPRFFLFKPPVNLTIMHETRWLEVLDNKHRYGGALEEQWERWKTTESTKNFFNWLAEQPGKISEVQYLSSTARLFYQLRVENGICKTDKEKTLHTEDVGTPHIFVLSAARICYVSRYERGYFHHSSLVAGEPVLAAGEMIFSKGKLIQITDKSGHYRTQTAAMGAMVGYLQKKSINMDEVIISMDCVREPFTGMRDARGKEFLKMNF